MRKLDERVPYQTQTRGASLSASLAVVASLLLAVLVAGTFTIVVIYLRVVLPFVVQRFMRFAEIIIFLCILLIIFVLVINTVKF